MSRYALVFVWLFVPLGILLLCVGCSSKSDKPGFLEMNGVKDADDLVFVIINMAEGGGSYQITDKPTLGRIFNLLNEAKPGIVSKYIRPNTVTLVKKNGNTLSFAFGLWNPGLTWHVTSPAFVKFVKTEIVKSSKYLNKERLPAFSISQIARIESLKKRTILPSARIDSLQSGINTVAAAYKPYVSITQTSAWSGITNFFASESPGIEVVLKNPIQFRTLIDLVGAEPSQSSTALSLVSLTVDRLVIYLGENRDLSLAFHSTAGSTGWYTTGRFGQNELQGRTDFGIYQELVDNAK